MMLPSTRSPRMIWGIEMVRTSEMIMHGLSTARVTTSNSVVLNCTSAGNFIGDGREKVKWTIETTYVYTT